MDRVAPGQLGYAVTRTARIDEALMRAVERGVGQVVILGAGYDTRALRIPGISAAGFDPAAQSTDMMAGLELRRPVRAASGFWVDGAGTVGVGVALLHAGAQLAG